MWKDVLDDLVAFKMKQRGKKKKPMRDENSSADGMESKDMMTPKEMQGEMAMKFGRVVKSRGNFGHAGRKGQRGGSAPGRFSPTLNRISAVYDTGNYYRPNERNQVRSDQKKKAIEEILGGFRDANEAMDYIRAMKPNQIMYAPSGHPFKAKHIAEALQHAKRNPSWSPSNWRKSVK